MKPKIGKRYVRADGEVTGVIERNIGELYCLYDPKHERSYAVDGSWVIGEKSHRDLVREYREGFKVGDKVRLDVSCISATLKVIGIYKDMLWLIYADGAFRSARAAHCTLATTKYRIVSDGTLYDSAQEARDAVKVEEVEG